jgi:uncharacterized membrane protein SirB2
MGLKHLHMLCAILSILLFVFRGSLKLQGSEMLRNKLLRIVPHVIDTVLLASAIGLAVLSAQYPFVQPWLTVKVIGLVIYIALGLMVMRFAQSQPVRLVCFVLAILVFGYILAVARTRMPLPFFG